MNINVLRILNKNSINLKMNLILINFWGMCESVDEGSCLLVNCHDQF